MNFFKKLTNFFLLKETPKIVTELEKPTEIFYKNKKHINGTTIVVYVDDVNKKEPIIFSKEDKDLFIFNQVDNVSSFHELQLLFTEVKNIETESGLESFIFLNKNRLENTGDFTVKGGNVFIKDTTVAIPHLIVADFLYILEEKTKVTYDKIFDDYYNRLILFWLKLSNSPIDSLENILKFCKENDVKISKRGNIIAYRRVKEYKVITEENVEWEFVSNWWDKIKKWKKSPKNYEIWRNFDNVRELIICKSEKSPLDKEGTWMYVGGLQDLKLKGNTSKKEKLYTSHYNSGKYSFPIPSLYKMENETPNPNLSNCAAGGLHCANVNYDYSGFGEIPVVVLVNPQKAIYVPSSDIGKFRTSEMYIACINPNGKDIHIDESLIEEADEVYNSITVEELKESLRNKSFSSLSAGNYVPSTSLRDIENITNIISERTIKI